MKVKMILMLMLVAIMTMGFECVNDNAYVAVNLQGITGVYTINPSTSNRNFNECQIFKPSTYLEQGFSTLGNVRLYDIRVSTQGTYTGTVSGNITVNGQLILSFSGNWSDFSTPQSLLTSTKFTRPNPNNGLATFVGAVLTKSDVNVCGVGSVSTLPVPSGLSLKVEILGQVDAKVN